VNIEIVLMLPKLMISYTK